MQINDMSVEAYNHALKNGFWSKPKDTIETKLLLTVCELAEATEELRDDSDPRRIYYNATPGKQGKPEGFPIELADAVIRIGDLAAKCGIDLAAAIEEKMAYNRTRPYRHGKEF